MCFQLKTDKKDLVLEIYRFMERHKEKDFVLRLQTILANKNSFEISTYDSIVRVLSVVLTYDPEKGTRFEKDQKALVNLMLSHMAGYSPFLRFILTRRLFISENQRAKRQRDRFPIDQSGLLESVVPGTKNGSVLLELRRNGLPFEASFSLWE